MLHEESIETLFKEIRSGSRRALARAVSLVESTVVADQDLASELLLLCNSFASPSRRIGLTGAPGVGKSTLMESFGLALIEKGHRVAVLAVDPSSKKTGGSILGDKLRMPHLSLHSDAFVRPSPSRLALGGTTVTTRDAITVCEAAGYDTIFVETVGVGQSETEVSDMVDLFLLLVLPTAGDDVQGIKRGIMEMAHALLVTKADIDDQATRIAVATYTSVLRLMIPSMEGWATPVLPVSALNGNGLDSLLELVTRFFDPSSSPSIEAQRRAQRKKRFSSDLQHELMSVLRANSSIQSIISETEHEVLEGSIPPSVAIRQLRSRFAITISERS
ncbi:MAG: methylmalonyl Co-A mutase-associated GTPase MeaB [Candidatus Kapabacteria bacterium]|nr:methylmalonyl Co-A mutase-associated GTPase MeaB [Candidatus Kapabacteria bacterium]